MPEFPKDPAIEERFKRLMNQHEFRRQQEKKNLILTGLIAFVSLLVLIDSVRLLHKAIHGGKHR
jgi:hypothetical protein